MTKPDFAELKEKLAQARDQYLNDRPHLSTAERHEAMKAFDAANSTTTELLDIIQSQSEALEHACNYLKDTGVLKIEDCEPDKQMYFSYIKSLSETNTRLQKLRENK